MFVVAGDFNRQPFNLIGLNDLDSGEFDDFVSYHEEEGLRKLLGNLFYDAFVAGLVGTPELFIPGNYTVGQQVVYLVGNIADVYECDIDTAGELPTDIAFWTKQAVNRWIRLKFGDEYLYYGRPQKWYGFNRLVVRLIYGLWMTDTYDKPTQSGVVITANENSTTVSPSKRIARAMNEYARLCAGDFPSVLDPNYMIWPELENSLFGYLYINSDTWEDLVVGVPGYNTFKAYLAYSFGWPGKTNVFGI